jgi:glutathione S-transferase/RNA polymerase-associated protein
MITLYEHPLSLRSEGQDRAAEKGLEFDARIPDLFGGSDAAFNAANPRREVPALLDGDVAVFDSTIILEYLEDRWPTPPLLPDSPAARARVRMLEELCDTYYEAINWAVFEVRVFQRASGALADQLLAAAAEQVAGVNAYLDRQLAGGPFFNGASFGWGDLCAVPFVSRGNRPRAANGSPWASGSRASPADPACSDPSAGDRNARRLPATPQLVESDPSCASTATIASNG